VGCIWDSGRSQFIHSKMLRATAVLGFASFSMRLARESQKITNGVLMLARTSLLAVLLLGLVVSEPFTANAEDWPQFCGPNCRGVSRSTNPLPTEFSFEQNVEWSTELGDGISSPIVAGGRVFSTAMVESDRLDVICHDAATGEKLWQSEVPIDEPPPMASECTFTSRSSGCWQTDRPEMLAGYGSYEGLWPAHGRGNLGV